MSVVISVHGKGSPVSIYPFRYESVRELTTRTGDGRDMAVSAGIALFRMRGTGSAWHRDDLQIRVGPRWSAVSRTVPMVSMSSIQSEHNAVNAGWAVDLIKLTYHQAVPGPPGVQVQLNTVLAVRDVDGYMFRASYHITTVGTLAAGEPAEAAPLLGVEELLAETNAFESVVEM